MRRDTLIDAIGKIDASFVEEAENWQKGANAAPKPQKYKFFGSRQRLLATAACLLLVSVSIFAALRQAAPDMAGEGSTAGNSDGAAPENEAAGNSSEAALENEAAGNGEAAPENGMADDGDKGEEAEGAPEEGAAPEKDGTEKALIPEEVTAVTVTHVKDGVEKQVRIEGRKLKALREWADSLILGPEADFEEGAYPGEDLGQEESFCFEPGETGEAFSYRKSGEWYVVTGDAWYPVENPTNPPV